MTAIALPEGSEISAAEMSTCGRYRYLLSRAWSNAPPVLFVMLNPSTADASIDDPTIRPCRGFARREGAGGLVVVNLYAYRATNPGDLAIAADPIGPDNDAAIDKAASVVRSERVRAGWDAWVIAAWGSSFPSRVGQLRAADVLARLRGLGPVMCLGVTSSGAPRHPLYVRSDAPLVTL